jgi:hypothetical protein
LRYALAHAGHKGVAIARGRTEGMVETADRLASATLDGRLLSFTYGVLIEAFRSWHVALYELPAGMREAARKNGHLVVETVTGRQLTGDVVTEFATQRGEYLLLTGVGPLGLASHEVAA